MTKTLRLHTFLLSHTWITIYRHYIRTHPQKPEPPKWPHQSSSLTGPKDVLAPGNISRQTACISLYFNDTKTLRHISYDYMQVGTSSEVHWSRPHDLSVDVQDGRRALVTVRIKVSSFALQNTTSLLAGNLLLLYAHTHRRGAGTSVRTEGLYPDNWKREEQLPVYTVRTLSVLPLSLFGVSLWYHFILYCDRQEITTHLTLSRKCLRHLLQMRATSATALETLSVCYQPFQLSFNIILVWFKYSTLLPELMMSSL